MSDFSASIHNFVTKVQVANQRVFLGVATEALRSIVEGSELTGAPGQPVDTGNLRASWQLTFPSPTSAQISTNVEYAPIIEDNLRGAKFRNHGPNSVKLTRAGLPRIVETVAAREAK